MSRLSQALRTSPQGQAVALRMQYFNVAQKHDRAYEALGMAYKYTLEATFSVQIKSTDADLKNGRHAEKINNARKLVIGEIFGEFMGPLSRALFACKNYDTEEAERLIEGVLKSMAE